MKKKTLKKVVSFALTLMMAFTAMMIGGVEVKAADPVYDITVAPSAPTAAAGESVTLTATVTKDGTAVTDLSAEGLAVYWWCTNNNNSGVTYDSSNSTLTNSVKVNAEGEYYFTVKLQETTNWTTIKEVYFTLTGTEGNGNANLDPVYNITVTPSAPTVAAGESVDLAAAVTKDGEAVTDLASAGLALYWWCTNNDNSGVAYDSSNSALTNSVEVNAEGEYYFTVKLQETTNWTTIKEVYFTLTGTEGSGSENLNPAPVYTIEASADKTSVTEGGTVKVTAVVKKDGVAVPQDKLEDEGVQVWFWADKWQTGHESGLVDATFANYDNNSGYSLTADVTLPSAGTYYIMAELRETAPSDTEKGEWLAEKCLTLAATGDTSKNDKEDVKEDLKEETKEEIKEEIKEETTTNKSEEKEEQKIVVFDVPLQNGSFTEEINAESLWKGSTKTGNWDGNTFSVFAYADDSWMEKPAGADTHCLKVDVTSGDELTIIQWVNDLKAGTYTLTMPIMGENLDVYLVIGDQSIKATTLDGWNSWKTAKATFTLKEDVASTEVGFKLVAKGATGEYNWGYIDRIEMQGGVPKTGDATDMIPYVMLMVVGFAVVGYSVKRCKEQF